jgi:hypothetical protein
MTADHASRSHARWSASATARNWACPGALAIIENLNLPDVEGEAAAWGTACHEVSEACLREYRDAIEFVDRVIKTKSHSITVDEEIAETAQVYIDYVMGRIAEHNEGVDDPSQHAQLFIERNFKLDAINPPYEAGGTGDAIIYFPRWKLLEIVDLKGGRGVVVEATNNKQARTYALGAMLEFQGLDVEQVQSTIVQPRAPHKDGRIRSEVLHVTDLLDWTSDLLERMHLSRAATDAFHACKGNSVKLDEWSEQHLTPGDHCTSTFCDARGACPKLKVDAFRKAGVFFDDLDQPTLKNTPDMLSVEELSKVLDAADMIEGFIKAARGLAHTLAEGGTDIPNYVLVERVGRRKFKLPDVELTAELLKLDGPVNEIYAEPKLKPMGALEKLFGKGKLDAFIEKPVTGTNLVRADKTTREPMKPAAERMFDILD